MDQLPQQQSNLSMGQKIIVRCKDFLVNSSMPGLKYIGGDQQYLIERLSWVVCFGLGVAFSVIMCLNVMDKYNSSPAVMSIESTDKKLSKFPFPSVTICNQNKLSKAKMDQFLINSSKFQVLTAEQRTLMFLVMVRAEEAARYADELNAIHDYLREADITINEVINITTQLMVSCDDMLLDCQFQGKSMPCMDLFELVPTDEGLCCGFNAIEGGWTLNGTKLKPNKIRTAHLPGYNHGLVVILDANVKDTGVSTGRSNGFKAQLHNPPEFPEVGERGFLISTGYEVAAAISPMSTYNTEDVMAYDLEKRACYMESENILEFYANYSISKCKLECQTRSMLAKCTCRPYYYAAKPSHPVCDLEGYNCLTHIFAQFRNIRNAAHCKHCYSKCQDVSYFNHLSTAPFPGQLFLDSITGKRVMKKKGNIISKSALQEYLKNNVAVLNVFYADMTGYNYRNDIHYGKDDLFSAMAGLMGLGFGFSILSAVEILYFVTIRWIFHRHDTPLISSLSSIDQPPSAMDENNHEKEANINFRDDSELAENSFREESNIHYSIND